jgi:succinate-acetate transporter protein
MVAAPASVVLGGTALSAGTYLLAFGDVAGGAALWSLGVVWVCLGLLRAGRGSGPTADGFG